MSKKLVKKTKQIFKILSEIKLFYNKTTEIFIGVFIRITHKIGIIGSFKKTYKK